MNRILGVLLLSVALALPFLPAAQAACPAGSPAGINCENYQGQVLDSVTGGTAQRKDQDRFNDHGVNIKEFGAIGDGSSHPLSGIYANLAAAQAVYSFVSDLSQEVDWAATQAAINYATANNFQNTYCPASSGGEFNGYQLSNPIVIDEIGNSRGTNPAWESGSTYGNGDKITYNGLPWQSLGIGNVGNPPTSASGYPANLAIAGNNLPYANVTITNGSSSIGLTSHGLSVGQPLIFLAQTYSSGALPTGISANQVYYVISTGLTTNAFEVSATPGGSAVTPSSSGTGVFTVSTQVWSLALSGGPDFSDRSNFIGDEGVGSSRGCVFNYFGLTTPAFVVGPNNGNLVKSIAVYGPGQQNGGGGEYRCNMPSGLAGIGNIADGAGSSRTKFVNVLTDGFYSGFRSNIAGGGTLGDSNSFEKMQLSDSCIGIEINSQENFINADYNSVISNDNTNASATLGTGLSINGGNYSSSNDSANQLTVTSVSVNVSSSVTLTATVTGAPAGANFPDGNLNNPLCAYNLQCVYGVVNIITQYYGDTPWHITGWNPFTDQITLTLNSDYQNAYDRATPDTDGFASDVQAQTTLYLSEVITTFKGSGINAKNVHVENDAAPTTLASSTTAFGVQLPEILEEILLGWAVSDGDNVCCSNQSGSFSLANQSKFYAQQTIPFINAGSPLTISGMGGGNNNNSIDRVLVEGGAHFVQTNDGSATPLMYNFIPVGALPKFGYSADGSESFGVGQYDNSLQTVAGAFIGNPYNYFLSFQETAGDFWTTGSWGQSPMWGVRPAPWSNPCITPAQVTALGSAAITFTSRLQYVTLNAIGSGYAQGDTITLAGGTFSTAGTVTVKSVNGGGGITSLNGNLNGGVGLIQNSGSTSYTVETSSFTQGSTSGHGTGATFNAPIWFAVYTAGYPLLWGGQMYNVCDYTGGSQTHYGLQSTNLGYSYFTNLTTSNVPNLSWSNHTGSQFFYMNFEALELMMPGLTFSVTAAGGSTACTSPSPQTNGPYIVTGVYPSLGYMTAILASGTSNPYTADWGAGLNCTGVAITQAGTNIVNPY